MPGYHGTKVSFQPEMHMMHQPRSKEVLYPRYYPMGKMVNPAGHPMFEAMRARHAQDKADYARMMRASKMGVDGGYPTFDSLKLLGAENDANYLDVFMNEGAKLHRYNSEDNDFRPRARSCSQTKSSKHDKRNSVNMDNITKTILGSLRSTASDENMYESVEVIQYRKTIEAINRQNKLRSVPKTGHPLFDHLRVERVLNSDRHHHSRQNSHNSDGGSNSQSSSGSGDEFDYARKPNCRFSRREVLMSSRGDGRKSHHSHEPHKHKNHKRDSHQNNPEAGSESDDDWAIPRPKICGGNGRSRRTGASGLAANGSHEESDSSSKSTGLR
ncbi:uncharacterized protein [Macrobrachium rosenbergii]|uniref:uncharacterized protein n=1 Tax=Macrobrachium rosenbergii TaxID=79674 RepID=UPI0034D75288